jgi:hypothetical protein
LRSIELDWLRGWLIGLWLLTGETTRDTDGAKAHAPKEDAASVIRSHARHLALTRPCSISMVRWRRKRMPWRKLVGLPAIVVVMRGGPPPRRRLQF